MLLLLDMNGAFPWLRHPVLKSCCWDLGTALVRIWNVPKGSCVKDLVPNMAILGSGGAFRKRGLVGGL
jgi:hypothetical protein